MAGSSLNKEFLIAIPAYNVEDHIRSVIQSVLELFTDSDVFIVNDGSTDKTRQILAEFPVNQIHQPFRKGKSFAIKEAFNFALSNNYQAVIFLDGDGQHNPKEIPKFIEKYRLHSVDIVLGKRQFQQSQMPLSRIFSNALSSFLVRKITHKKINDSQCGFRLISKKYYQLDTSFDGFQFETEHLVKALLAGAQLQEIEIQTIYNSSKSSMKYLRDTIDFIRLFRYLFRLQRELKDVQSISPPQRKHD